MNDELDFEGYPTLHLHMMIDDYEELSKGPNGPDYSKTIEEEYIGRNEYYCGVDPQGRFSFCFSD